MSFDEKDITILKQMFDEQSRDLRDYVDNRITASEKRQDATEERLMKRMEETEIRLLNAMDESHDMLVQPKLDDHELRITKLESNAPVHTS